MTEDGRHVVLAGHHRSMAALIQGRPVLARVVRADRWEPTPVLPNLLIGRASSLATVVTDDANTAADAVLLGRRTLVPDMATALRVMAMLGLDRKVIEDRYSMASTGRCAAAL